MHTHTHRWKIKEDMRRIFPCNICVCLSCAHFFFFFFLKHVIILCVHIYMYVTNVCKSPVELCEVGVKDVVIWAFFLSSLSLTLLLICNGMTCIAFFLISVQCWHQMMFLTRPLQNQITFWRGGGRCCTCSFDSLWMNICTAGDVQLHFGMTLLALTSCSALSDERPALFRWPLFPKPSPLGHLLYSCYWHH